jgi:hypothetical protein
MKNHRSFWLMVALVGLLLVGISARGVKAANYEQFQVEKQIFMQVAAQTPSPAQPETPEVTETPEERILPPVGGNAVLVLGASVLVLIIIGGVMIFSWRRSKH